MPIHSSEGSEEDDGQKRPKYAAEKKFASVLSAGFDKTLTIQKARFDSTTCNLPHPPSASTSTPLLAPHTDSDIAIPSSTKDTTSSSSSNVPKAPPLTTSVTLPIVNTLQSINSVPSITASAMPSQSTPLMTKSTKLKNEDRRTIKRKNPPPMNGTATPSEVFHRNLVDAVSNVEDSDENEQYVYPYNGNNTDTTYMNSTDTIHRTTSSSLYRPQSTRSFANTSQQDLVPKSSSGFLGDLLRPILFKSKSDSRNIYKHQRQQKSNNSEDQFSRPKLRSYIMDHPYSQSKHLQTNDFFDGKHSPPLYYSGASRSHSSRKVYSSYGIGDGGYTTDDEEAQHLLAPTLTSRRSQQARHRGQSNRCWKMTRNVFIFVLSAMLVLFLCITYLAKPLRELDVEISRVLSSDKELIFDLRINAINANLWTVHVAEADISVFAFSQVVPMQSSVQPNTRGVDPAEYLGGFYHFDEPLSFRSSIISKKHVTAISQIRIKSPGADKSGNERWSRIIRYPYGLVVRGVLKYRPLSFLSPYPQSIAICDVVRVNPTTDKVSEDPDQGFCLSYGGNHSVITTALIDDY